MKIREANEAGLITVGRRIKTDGNGAGRSARPFTGRIVKVFTGYFRVDRDDGITSWKIEFDNTEAQIEMLDHVPFKKGDFVKLSIGDMLGTENQEWWKEDELELGSMYVVHAVTDGGWIKIRGTPCYFEHHPDHFTLVSSPSKTKEDKQGENVMNTKSVAVNDTIGEVLGDKKYKTVMLVNKYFGEEIPNNFTGKMLLEDKKDQFIKEAEDREKEALKKAAAKK